MAEDIIKPKGPTSRSSPFRGGANPRLAPILGIVKDNVDPTRSGKIMVYIADNSGSDPEDKSNWRPVRFLSPFYGLTRPVAGNDDLGSYKANPSSYGMWFAPPDIGTTVVCVFINGDMNYGFYIGCVPEPEALTMVPAIGATDNIIPNEGEAKSFGGALRLPVTNINTNNKNVADSVDYITAPKPIHSYTATVMNQQGVIRDPVRGPISSSSQRETPSRVGWGISTPGRPIYEGGFDDKTIAENLENNKAKQLRVVSRRGGHTIVMDDGDIIGRDQLVRIRTALGHQILMSDDGQTLMILHSNGQSYIELGKEGTVDIYSTNSVNLRTQGDLNLHADSNINIHATKNLNLQGENIHLNSEKEYKQRVGSDYSNFTQGKHTTKVSGAMSMESAGDISMASSAIAYVNGSKVNLNTGKTSTTPAEVPAIDKTLHTDTLFDKEKGWLAAPAKLVSITTRAPAHAPWANAGQGVDIKNNPDAASNLPAAPSSSVQSTNAAAASAGVSKTVQPATTASAPPVTAASPALSKQTTQALTGQIATDAANGPLAQAVTQGTTVAKTAAGTQVGVGTFAQTAEQLQTSNVLKPGSAPLVNALAAATGNVKAAMTNNLFTGQPGAENLQSLVNNVQAQTESVVKNIQSAQNQLQNTGLITGSESATQLGGMVMSAAKNGVDATLSAVKNSATSAAAGALGSAAGIAGKAQSTAGNLSGALQDIAKGNFAAKAGEAAAGALSGLQGSVDAIAKSPSLADVVSQAQGVAASAFSAIKAGFKPMQAGVPQNLTALAKESAKSTVEAAAAAAGSAATDVSSLTNSVKGGLVGLKNAAGGALSSVATSTISGVTSNLAKSLPNTGSIADALVSASKTNVGSVASKAINDGIAQLSSTAKSVENAAGAFTDPTSLVKNVTGSGSLLDAAKSTAGGIATASATLASGVSNLPGGAAAVSSVTNLAKGALPSLPGTAAISSTIKNSATNALNSLQGQAAGLADAAKGKLDGLKSLASSGLPAGAAAQLENALGSMAAAGSGIKMPSIALNTTDRSALTSAITSQLGDPGIPVPNFGEVAEQAKGKIEEIAKTKTEFLENSKKLAAEYSTLREESNKLYGSYLNLKDTLPQGDPLIESARKKALAAARKTQDALNSIQDLYKQNPELASTNTNSTGTGRILSGDSSTGIGAAT